MALPEKIVETNNNIIELKRSNKEKQLQMQEDALELIHDNLESAVQVLIDGLSDEDPYVRLRCAEDILRKVLPDKKTKEITGKDGDPIKIETTDKRAAVMTIVEMLDGIGFDELRKRASGSERIFDAEFRTEEEAQTGIPEEEEADQGRERPGQIEGPGESPESVIPVEAGPGERSFDRRREENSVRPRRREEY